MRLRIARKGLTQWELTLKTGISQTRISLIENGYVKPTEDEKVKIAEALGLKVEEVFPPDDESGLRTKHDKKA